MLANISIRALVAAALVGTALAALRVRAGAVRHASWTAVLVAMLLMPVLVRSVPAIAVPIPLAASAFPSSSDVKLREAVREPAPTRSAEFVRGSVDGSHGSGLSDAARRPPAIPVKTLRVDWVLLTSGLYGLGAVAMMLRFLVGWWGAARIAASADRLASSERLAIAHTPDIDVRESRAISVPVTVGVIRCTVLLPSGWSGWSNEKLRAVLAHEVAHVRRRDPLVAFIGQLNRCLFWFHPLSWFLERILAATAEQAADEEAMAALGDRTAYAEILLEMARAVAPGGGRVAWLGVGIDGSGLLKERIACALSGARSRRVSAVRKAMLAISCVSAILLAVACRPSATSSDQDAALEQRDRVLHLRVLQVAESQWRHFADVDWEAESNALASHERALAGHSDDLDALRQLLVSYWARYTCRAVADCGNPSVTNKVVDERLLAIRRTSIVWLIEQHPESDLAGAVEARIFPEDVAPFFPADRAGYAQAKAAWIAHTLTPDVSAVVLGHAADFLEVADKPLAEQMLLRARALNPEGRWIARLGRFYRDALLGSQVMSGRNSMRLVSAGAPQSPYATALRAKLAKSTDEELLTATAWFLSGAGTRPWVEVNPAAIAESYLTRVLQINPRAVFARTVLLGLRRQRRNSEPLWRVAPADRDAYLAALPERQRFEALPELAKDAFRMVSEFDHLNDDNLRGRFELGHDQAKRYANDALKLAPKFTDDPAYGTAVYTANMTLSALALRDGDHKASILYLERASEAPSSEQLAYGDDVVWHRLVRDLVAQGERGAAIAYLERLARTSVAQRIELREWAAQLRSGVGIRTRDQELRRFSLQNYHS
jgi:beta-lactamase regulating signal transducer with metallopeptidase domain